MAASLAHRHIPVHQLGVHRLWLANAKTHNDSANKGSATFETYDVRVTVT